jgi:acyl-homoserine lactone acylase PvdQ
VAWSQTQLMGDITDWYAEELQLGDDGLPSATLFQGTWEPVLAYEETHVIADVPLLGSEGRTETWTRYTTFDGRWIADVEGTAVAKGTAGAVTFPGGAVIPSDVDGDGVVTAISFDYTAFSDGNLIHAVDRFGHAGSVDEFRDATKYLVAYSQNMGVADKYGDILYTGYQAVPCRGYLPRDADGHWIDGADPSRLIDGTLYGAFEIPTEADGKVIEAGSGSSCVVPWADYPAAVTPEQGWIANGNNDPAGITDDDDFGDDPWYIGGPWVEGWRVHRIGERLEEEIAVGTADVDGMAAIQADHQSAMGYTFAAHLIEAIQAGRSASTAGATEGSDGRLAALYDADAATYDEVESRLQTWLDRGAFAESGIQTFYHSPTDEQEDDAVATTLFNAWMSAWDDAVFADENLPSVWNGGGTAGRVRMLVSMLEGRGPKNPGGLASWNADTEESVFFDDMSTEEVETSDEIALEALATGIAFLRSAPDDDLRGSGFGDTDMSTWKWGFRHWTRFESVLSDFVDSEEFSFLTEQFSITTDVLPLQGEAGTEDIEWFPRPGDNLSVDAANSGLGTDWTHGSGPVFRMVFAIGEDGVTGQNVIPGGQSALIDSPYFADQTALWLANDTLPVNLAVDEVVAAATGREVLEGGDCD